MSSQKKSAAGPLRHYEPRPQDAGRPDGLRIRFCGGCNPFIDRVAVAESVRRELSGTALDCALFVSGCPRACASDRRLSMEEDAAVVVVAGEHVDAAPTPAAQIAHTVIRKLASPTAPPHPDRRTGDIEKDQVAHEG